MSMICRSLNIVVSRPFARSRLSPTFATWPLVESGSTLSTRGAWPSPINVHSKPREFSPSATVTSFFTLDCKVGPRHIREPPLPPHLAMGAWPAAGPPVPPAQPPLPLLPAPRPVAPQPPRRSSSGQPIPARCWRPRPPSALAKPPCGGREAAFGAAPGQYSAGGSGRRPACAMDGRTTCCMPMTWNRSASCCTCGGGGPGGGRGPSALGVGREPCFFGAGTIRIDCTVGSLSLRLQSGVTSGVTMDTRGS
mmetsp:Transcript_86043/g.244100  ORF Transcript_86043/g.244100 Transcript_86043/m.244100 type:complete len:251 (+) Transcript_86043:261-1013(+)